MIQEAPMRGNRGNDKLTTNLNKSVRRWPLRAFSSIFKATEAEIAGKMAGLSRRRGFRTGR
jgi:hypothetical protein